MTLWIIYGLTIKVVLQAWGSTAGLKTSDNCLGEQLIKKRRNIKRKALQKSSASAFSPMTVFYSLCFCNLGYYWLVCHDLRRLRYWYHKSQPNNLTSNWCHFIYNRFSDRKSFSAFVGFSQQRARQIFFIGLIWLWVAKAWLWMQNFMSSTRISFILSWKTWSVWLRRPS